MTHETVQGRDRTAKIKVIGVGGGGGNAVSDMVSSHSIEGVDFICLNTDAQVLSGLSKISQTLQLGQQITRGLGAGADPSIGRQAAEESRDQIAALLEGTDLLFIAAGMGGGTGTGAAPIVAQIAKEMGILTVAVVTKPFAFEGRVRMQVAEQGIRELSQYVDSLIAIPNNKLLSVLGREMSLVHAFKAANHVLHGAVQGIAELITRPGLINVDFADVVTVMSQAGVAVMGTAHSVGDDRARRAAEAAVTSPLLEDIDLAGARGVLVNITAGLDLSIGEFEEVGEVIKAFTSEGATVVVGTVIDPSLTGEMRVTVVVTGLGRVESSAQQPLLRTESSRSSVAPDYRAYDKPAIQRRHLGAPLGSPSAASPQNERRVAPTPQPKDDPDYFDIPAFLRKREEEHI